MKSTDLPSGVLRPAEDEAVVGEAADSQGGGSGRVPIGVSDGGDFSTPTRRSRKITRPRGLRTLESLASGGVAAAGNVLAEGPPPAPPPAAPLWIQAARAVQERRESTAVDEFLAAPPTPVPESEATPLPISISFDDAPPSSGDPAAAAAAPSETATPVSGETGEVAVSPPTQMPAASVSAVGSEFELPIEEEPGGVAATPPAEDAPRAQMAFEIVEAAPVETPSPVKLPAPSADFSEIEPADGEAEAGAAAGQDPLAESSSLSPLALTLAHMAEALHVDLRYEAAEDIEFLEPELPVVVAAVESPRPNTPPPLPRQAKLPEKSPLVAVRPEALVPEALAERPRRPKRSKPWYEEIFDENYLRTLPFMTAEQTLREVDFLQAALNPAKGARLLDVGCGYGRHAIELVQRGLEVTGLDLSLPLLMRAAEESQRRNLTVELVHGDMRKMAFERQFDGAYCMLTTFGYFDEESNLNVAEAMGRALKPGGRLLLDVINRDYIVGDLPARIWWEGDGCVVLEEVEFNFNTNRLMTHRSVVFDDGRQLDQEISLRAYCLHDLGKLLRQAGFRVLEVSGSIATKGQFFGATSRNLLVVAERRAD